MTTKQNRIRVVLAELNKKNKWLVEELGKNQAILSKWYSNVKLSFMETFVEISNVLDVDIRQLLNPIKEK